MKKFIESQPHWRSLIVMFAISIVASLNSVTNPILSKIMAEFPEAAMSTVRFISTLPSIVNTIIVLLIGPMIGKKIGYRPVCIIGMILYGLGGIGPFFLNQSIAVILACRFVYGIGLGLIGCRVGYALLMTAGDNKAGMTALQTMTMNASSVFVGILAGYLGDINWRYAFVPFTVCVIPLIMVITMMKEPDKQESGSTVAVVQVDDNAKLSKKTYMYCIYSLFSGIVGMSWMTGMSALLVERGSESSAQVAMILSSCQTGAIFGSILFATLSKKAARHIALLSALAGAITSIGVVLINNFYLLMATGFVAGVGYVMGMVMTQSFAGLSNLRSKTTQATTLVMASMTLSNFITPFYFQICGNALGSIAPSFTAASFIVSTVISGGLVVFSLVYNFAPQLPVTLEDTNSAPAE